METEYLGNAYTTQSSNDGCVAVACPIDAGCAINACGTAAYRGSYAMVII